MTKLEKPKNELLVKATNLEEISKQKDYAKNEYINKN